DRIEFEALYLKDVNKDVEHDPHHIYEVPVPASRLEGEVVFWRKVTF
ncbi:hypothetical protein MGSAQ_001945, partial [marine sediment metagenome]